MIDNKTYTVTGPNGFRQGNLTETQARRLAEKMLHTMQQAGWAGKVDIYYRDGSLVQSRKIGA